MISSENVQTDADTTELKCSLSPLKKHPNHSFSSLLWDIQAQKPAPNVILCLLETQKCVMFHTFYCLSPVSADLKRDHEMFSKLLLIIFWSWHLKYSLFKSSKPTLVLLYLLNLCFSNLTIYMFGLRISYVEKWQSCICFGQIMKITSCCEWPSATTSSN